METLEYLIYGYFYIQLFRWVFTLIVVSIRSSALVEFKLSYSDNILWIAPVIYFTGGLA